MDRPLQIEHASGTNTNVRPSGQNSASIIVYYSLRKSVPSGPSTIEASKNFTVTDAFNLKMAIPAPPGTPVAMQRLTGRNVLAPCVRQADDVETEHVSGTHAGVRPSGRFIIASKINQLRQSFGNRGVDELHPRFGQQ